MYLKNSILSRFKECSLAFREVAVNKTKETAATEVDTASINERLGKGDKTALNELDAQGIPYTLTETGSGYKVKYSYEGTDYTITYYASARPETEQEKTPESTIVPGSLAQKTDEKFSIESVNVPEYTLEVLQNTYGFTTSQIEEHFDYIDFDNGTVPGSGGWILKTGRVVNGVVINTIEDLLEALNKNTTQGNEAVSENTETTFDYSGVNKDAKAEDFYNENNIPDDKKFTMILGRKGDVDSGAWDNLFAELEKMKPQLKEYLRQQLESVGRVYDEEKAEKIINILITQSVKRIPQEGAFWSVSVSGIGDPAMKQLPENPTIEDLMNYMKNCLDLTPEEKENGIFTQMVNTISSGYEHIFELAEDEENILKVNTYSSYYEEDGYLLNTADYFLTDEEKEMKFVMQVTDSEYSSYGTSDKTKLFGYIDTYAKHLEKVIRHRHPSLSDTQITSIMTDAKNKVKYSDLPKPNENGIYSIDDTLAKLEELVLKYADEYTK